MLLCMQKTPSFFTNSSFDWCQFPLAASMHVTWCAALAILVGPSVTCVALDLPKNYAEFVEAHWDSLEPLRARAVRLHVEAYLPIWQFENDINATIPRLLNANYTEDMRALVYYTSMRLLSFAMEQYRQTSTPSAFPPSPTPSSAFDNAEKGAPVPSPHNCPYTLRDLEFVGLVIRLHIAIRMGC